MRLPFSALLMASLLAAPMVLVESASRPVVAQTAADDRTAKADRLLQQARQYVTANQPHLAIKLWQQVVQLYREVGDREQEAFTLRDLADGYNSSGQSSQAIDAYQQALAIFREMRDDEWEAITLSSLGHIYHSLSRYPLALESHQKALAIFQKIGDRDWEAVMLKSLGSVYGSLGQDLQALEYYQRALSIHRDIRDRHGEGTTLTILGSAYRALGQHQTSIDHHQQAVAIFQEIGDRQWEAWAREGFCGNYNALSQHQEAIECYQQALSVFQTIKFDNADDLVWLGLGNAHTSLSQYPQALAAYQKALSIAQADSNRQMQRIVLSSMAALFTKQEQPELAIVFYKQAVNISESIRNELQELDQELQQSYTESIAYTYRQLADLLLQQDRVLEAQRVLDLLKVQELEDYLQNVRGNADTRTGVEVLHPEQEILARYEALQATAIQLGQELAALNQKKTNSSLTPTEEQRRQELSKLQEELNQQFNDFANSPDIIALIEQLTPKVLRQTVDLADLAGLQDNLQTLDAALFYPLILEDRIELVITTANTPPLRRTVKVDRTTLNETIVAFRQALQNPTIDAKAPAQKLYEWLIAPIVADLQQANVKTIIYAPDGVLRYIPLAALYDADQQQWLAQQYRVNNITAKSLTEFDTRPQTTPQVLAAAFADETITHRVPVGAANIDYSGLPFAGKEVSGLSALMPNTTVLIDHAFSLDAVMPVAGFNIIHFATHAVFVTGAPTESFILFGNGDRPTLRDVETWTLANVDLVVLSACETGLGGQYGNGEEILGLGYQFQARGARAVMASLWQVNDGGTQVLMNAFYYALENGMTKAKAIQQAQIALITGDMTVVWDPRGSVVAVSTETGLPMPVSNSLNHPHYWAPFILIGNGL